MSTAAFIFFVVVGCLVAIGTAKLLPRRTTAEPVARFASLDGVRGFAALAVYFEHAAGWHHLSTTGGWDFQPKLAWVAGTTAVSVFFMITAFLFVDKVVLAPRPTDWLRLGMGRVLRMLPLFVFVLALVLLVVATRTAALRESPADLVLHIARWLPLTLFGTPDINRLENTWLITAGATWTLPYECLFYLALPAIAFCSRRPVPRGVLLFASIAFLGVLTASIAPGASPGTILERLLSFPAGAGAALLLRSSAWMRFARGRTASVAVLVAGLLATWLALHHRWSYSVAFQAIAFALIAGGNTVGGLLTTRSARRLGEISYSIYLLHGVLLYLVMDQWLGRALIAGLPVSVYWLLVVLLVPALVLCSCTTYRFIERPWIERAPRWADAVRARAPLPPGQSVG